MEHDEVRLVGGEYRVVKHDDDEVLLAVRALKERILAFEATIAKQIGELQELASAIGGGCVHQYSLDLTKYAPVETKGGRFRLCACCIVNSDRYYALRACDCGGTGMADE